MSVNRLPALKADSDIFTTFEGDNTVLMLWIGRQLLARHIHAERERTAGESPDQGDRMAELVADIDRLHNQSDADLFARRAEATIREVHEVAQGRLGQGVPEHEVASGDQSALLRASLAYMENVLLQQFTATVEAQPEAICAQLAPHAEALVDAFGIPAQCLAAPIAGV